MLLLYYCEAAQPSYIKLVEYILTYIATVRSAHRQHLHTTRGQYLPANLSLQWTSCMQPVVRPDPNNISPNEVESISLRRVVIQPLRVTCNRPLCSLWTIKKWHQWTLQLKTKKCVSCLVNPRWKHISFLARHSVCVCLTFFMLLTCLTKTGQFSVCCMDCP